MPQSNQGVSGRNSSTSKQSGDKQRSTDSEKGKAGRNTNSHGAQGQKGKEDMGKGKMNSQRESSDRDRSGSEDDE